MHTAMMCVAIPSAAYLAWRGESLAFYAALLSQVPFWVGFSVWAYTGILPLVSNMVADLIVAGLFLLGAHIFGKALLIWISLIFVLMGIIDVWALTFGMSNYLELHEFLHYSSIILCLGSFHVERIDRFILHHLASGEDR